MDTGLRKVTELLRLQVEHINFDDSPVFFNIGSKDIEVLPNHLLVVRGATKRAVLGLPILTPFARLYHPITFAAGPR